MTDTGKKALELHKKHKGKIGIMVNVPLATTEDFSVAYMPGVAEVAMACTVNAQNAYDYTIKSHTVAVVSDGSSVLGLGNVGPIGAIPVMEGKAMLYKRFVDLDAFPICLATQETEEIIQTIRNIAPIFGGIHLEDISSPRCFDIENKLADLDIPVMHDDQHGTAVVVRAALSNAVKVVGKKLSEVNVVISGGGAAGQTIAKFLIGDGAEDGSVESVADVVVVDSKGIIVEGREDLDSYKKYLAERTNKQHKSGTLGNALEGCDVFIGVSRGNIVSGDFIPKMKKDPIVFALSNPDPEIHPNKAKEAGAAIIATGRSDFPNQVNNALGYPGLFKGALEAKARKITFAMKLAAANAIAAEVENPTAENIMPSIFKEGLFDRVTEAVKEAAQT